MRSSRLKLAGALAAVAGLILAAAGIFLLSPRAAQPALVLYSPLRNAPAIVKSFTGATGIPVRLVTAPHGHPHWSLAWIDAAAVLVAPRAAGFPPPTRWADLAKPAFRGLVGMADPAVSRLDYPVLAALLDSAGGWPGGKGFVKALKRHGLHIYATDRATLAALRSGAIQLAIVRAAAGKTSDKSLRVIVPRPVPAHRTTIILANTLSRQRRAAAEKFMAYVGSAAPTPTHQAAITGWFARTIVGAGQ